MIARENARFKIWLILLSVFLLGCLTGAALDGVYRARPDAGKSGAAYQGKREAMFEDLRRDLNLSDEQAAAVRKILDETLREYEALRQEVRPRYEEARLRMQARLRALLRSEQQQRFDTKMAEWDARGEQKLKGYEQQGR